LLDCLYEHKTMQDIAKKYLWTAGMPWEWIEQMGPVVFQKGKDSCLYSIDGKRYYDGMSGAWVVNIGHGRTEMAEVMNQQAKELAYVLVEGYANIPAIQLAEKVANLISGNLNRVFFTCGGSEAVESALKVARQYFVFRDKKPRYKILSRRLSYHGATFGAMGVTGFEGWRWPFSPHIPGIRNVPHPYCYKCEFDLNYPSCTLQCVQTIEQIIEQEGPENIGVFIAEPVSMSIGTAVPPKEYWQSIRNLCNKYGILLVADEIITGFGRTGEWFALNHWGITPDIILLGKGIASGYAPLAAMIVKEEIAKVLDKQGFIHGFTYSGHPVACAAALKNIEIIENENLVMQANKKGKFLKQLMTEILDGHPLVGETRTFGLLATIELVVNKQTKERIPGGYDIANKLKLYLLDHGLTCRVGSNILLGPPLIIKEEELYEIIKIIRKGLDWFYNLINER
jgi:putrescine aminotransferase